MSRVRTRLANTEFVFTAFMEYKMTGGPYSTQAMNGRFQRSLTNAQFRGRYYEETMWKYMHRTHNI